MIFKRWQPIDIIVLTRKRPRPRCAIKDKNKCRCRPLSVRISIKPKSGRQSAGFLTGIPPSMRWCIKTFVHAPLTRKIPGPSVKPPVFGPVVMRVFFMVPGFPSLVLGASAKQSGRRFCFQGQCRESQRAWCQGHLLCKETRDQGNVHVPKPLCAPTSQELSSRYRVGNILAQTLFWPRSLQPARVALVPELRVGFDRFSQPAYACRAKCCGITRRRNMVTAHALSITGYVCHHSHKYRRIKLEGMGSCQ